MSSQWMTICELESIAPNTGICAKVDNHQAAVFYLQPENIVKSISNYDPIAGANILSRGIVAEIEGKRVVASPLYKQHFCLDSGVCLEDESIRVATFQTRLKQNFVQIKTNS